MRSSISTDIGATAQLVFALASDVERWPALLPHYRAVRVLQRHADGSLTARMLAVRPVVPAVGYGIPVAWRARIWALPAERRLRFRHLGGATDGMDVTWRIERRGDVGCQVTIEHDFAPPVPGWARFVDSAFVRPIAGRTLATFRAIAEAASAEGESKRSSGAATAKE